MEPVQGLDLIRRYILGFEPEVLDTSKKYCRLSHVFRCKINEGLLRRLYCSVSSSVCGLVSSPKPAAIYFY